MRMKLSPGLLVLILIFSTLIIVEILQITGVISLWDMVYSNFDAFMFALVFISVLSIIGAVFLGMFISHKIMSISGFTPFEEEMLLMREDIKEIKIKLEEKKE